MVSRRVDSRRTGTLAALVIALLLAGGCGDRPPATPTPRPDGLSAAEAATLDSLEQVDGYPLYTMHYYGDYVVPTVRQGATGQALRPAWACSLFAALGDAGKRLYGRNFDWRFSPALLLFTDPPDGYASVSMVDLGYLAGEEEVHHLADLPLGQRRGLLATPLWPFDGMNEWGLAVGMAAVPPGDMTPTPSQETVDSLSIIRLMLDQARNVDEALAIFERYRVDMGAGPPLHYLVADRSGRSVLVEFYQGERVVLPNDEPWHLATNFLRASVAGSAAGQCWRYDRIQHRLAGSGGRLLPAEALDLLAQVAQENTQWSVVYGLSSGDVAVTMGRQYETPLSFHLPLAAPAD